MTEPDTLIALVPTIRFGRKQATHGYKLAIEGQNVRMYTRCGLPTLGVEYTITHGVISCEACTGGEAA